MSVLDLNNVATGFGDLKVVFDATVRVEPGKVTAMLGRNGAGKTTTLRAITGLNKLTSGRITLNGRDIAALTPYQRARAGIAYVQEGKRIFRSRSVEENLVLGSYASRNPRRQRELRDEMFERFPILGERRKMPAGGLSGGQQQMLAIAQALVSEPTVLLLDEPSAGLAPTIVADVLKVIQDLKARDLAVLLVEQAVEFALAAADRVVVLNLGRTVYTGTTEDPNLRAAIQRAYLEDEIERMAPS